jgi:hypothetical protein
LRSVILDFPPPQSLKEIIPYENFKIIPYLVELGFMQMNLGRPLRKPGVRSGLPADYWSEVDESGEDESDTSKSIDDYLPNVSFNSANRTFEMSVSITPGVHQSDDDDDNEGENDSDESSAENSPDASFYSFTRGVDMSISFTPGVDRSDNNYDDGNHDNLDDEGVPFNLLP